MVDDNHPSPERAPRRRRRILRNVSFAARLSLVALVVTLLSLAVTAGTGLYRGNELAEELADSRLVTVTASQGADIETNFANLRRQVSALATSPGAVDAIVELADAYREFADGQPSAAAEETLVDYYVTDVVPALEEVRGQPVSLRSVFPDGPAAIELQSLYTIPPTIPTDDEGEELVADPALVFDAGDGSTYSALHETIHAAYGPIAVGSGFQDLFLVSAEGDTVVYSTRKRTDFATSLELGPLSGSALAGLVDELQDVARGDEPGTTLLTDYTSYPPALDRPVAFIGSPVLDGERLVGHLVAAIGTGAIDANLVTGETVGAAETGEIYVAGGDAVMRSTAQPYTEAPGPFLAATAESTTPTLSDAQRRRINATGTTALVQPVNRRTIDAALAGSGLTETVNYRGEPVVAAYRPLDVDGVDWVVVAEISTDELEAPIGDYGRELLFAVALFVVAVTFAVVRWSDRTLAPVRAIATRLRAARAGADPGADPAVAAESTEEFHTLGVHIDDMLTRLDERAREVDRRTEERRGLFRQFLPDAVARRADASGSELLDHVESATAVVLILREVDRLVDALDESDVRPLLARLVDEFDALATDFGLERAKVTGNAYVAVCGATRPYLDHVPRSVGFALAARELAEEIAAEFGLDENESFDVRVGVDTGPVSIGLAGRSGLVYDAWGDAVSRAGELARRAPDRGVAVTARAGRQLPDRFAVGDDLAADAVLVVGIDEEVAT